MDRNHLILFISNGRNNLHLMAESFARNMAKDGIGFISAALSPKINPLAGTVMLELGINISQIPLIRLSDIEPVMFDLIITLGSFDQNFRPTLPNMPPHLHWDIPDPWTNAAEHDILEALRNARDELKIKIETLLDSRLLKILFVERRNLELILDNLMDGVMAHTSTRQIFFFNQEAERITGHRKEDILGKDCHTVFPGRFCGGDCEFCNGMQNSKDNRAVKREVTFIRPDGRERVLRMSSMPLTDEEGKCVGALLSFKDDTEIKLLRCRLKEHHSVEGLIGRDPKILAIFDHIREVSSVCVPVLIEGESGTGKELVANAVHNLGPRADKPFVAINCGALPEDILESELFGHVRGAFSGAVQDRKGRFELADGGTIFLDEVGELSPTTQVKLLRVLQEQRFERVGGETSIQVNVRVISATNQNLRKMMEKKQFRSDLFYRLCVIPITLPPLRERPIDIPFLVDHFLDLTAKEICRPTLTLSNEVLDVLIRYPWPGNIRELRNAIEYAYVKCRSRIINIEHLPPEIAGYRKNKNSKPGPALKKKEQIIFALEKAKGNKKKAARELGIGRSTLYRYLDTYDLK